MLRILSSVVLVIGLGACSDRAMIAAPYKSAWDRAALRLGVAPIFHRPCHFRDGEVLVFVGAEKCFRFDPPERMRGLWLNRGEDAEFRPDATAAVVPTRSQSETWLDFTRPEPLLMGEHPAYAIEVVGRRATYPGHYGHMGMSRHLILVDEILSATPVTPAGKGP